MNVNPKIEEIFNDFTVDNIKIPIFFMNYIGKEQSYLTYYTWLEQPDLFADNQNNIEKTFGTIDVFSKNNYKNIIEAVKQKLKDNGFTWTDSSAEDFEEDTKYYHVAVNFYVINVDLI